MCLEIQNKFVIIIIIIIIIKTSPGIIKPFLCFVFFQVIPDTFVSSILKTCSSNSYEQLEVAVKDMLREGYSATQIISQVSTVIGKLDIIIARLRENT